VTHSAPPARTGEEPELPDWLDPLLRRVPDIRGEDLSAFVPPEQPPPREGAVLVLFGDGPKGPDLLLTERAHTMRSQPGQVSFPGGSLEPGESAVDAALREAHEETGLDVADVTVFAVLPRLWLPPRNFAVAPVLGYWGHEAHLPVTNPREVHAVIREPIERLLDPSRRFTVRHPLGWAGPGWMIGPGDHVMLWGFTAGIISALFDLVGWTREWDRTRERQLPQHLIEWNRVARQLGIDVPEGETFDPVAAGLVADPAEVGERSVRPDQQAPRSRGDLDREHKPGR
jgi:8-oxo-dGTP pyrophosphatase MutT (NUDIX family)